MRVINAPETIDGIDRPTVFLAGGITNCPEWQDEIIEILKDYSDGIILNPKRKNFPIHDPNAALEQITWEFHALNNCDIFSMWFSASESVQPICLYELGRHLALKRSHRVVIGVEPGYKRAQDVYIQTKLVNEDIAYRISADLLQHAKNIITALNKIGSCLP